MSGENSKRSGEIGEKLVKALLERIGWSASLSNISIPCNTAAHLNPEGNRRQSHGEDRVFLYNNPFHDDRTDVVHVSVKNHLGGYPKGASLKSAFKKHLGELLQTIECARFSEELRDITTAFKAKKNIAHSGLLCWLHNDSDDIERDIKPELQSVRLDSESSIPVFLIDNARAAFILKVADDLERRHGTSWEFYFPRTGTAVSADEGRAGNYLPLELLGSDIVPVKALKNREPEMLVYADQSFSFDSYLRLYAYGLHFASGWVSNVLIGTPDYNEAVHAAEASRAKLAFNHRSEEVSPFSFRRTLVGLLEEAK